MCQKYRCVDAQLTTDDWSRQCSCCDNLTIDDALDSYSCFKFVDRFLSPLLCSVLLSLHYRPLCIAETMKNSIHSFQSPSQKHTISTFQAPDASFLEMDTFTVVELFQSQGFSSCPPTSLDVLKLAEDPNLLILTFHATYWNRLGWKDTFGDFAFD